MIAVVAITVVLLAIRRNILDTVLVMSTLILAGLFTMASAVLTDTPINFANIIALPLLLGLGVDNGIHMLVKLRDSLSGLKTGGYLWVQHRQSHIFWGPDDFLQLWRIGLLAACRYLQHGPDHHHRHILDHGLHIYHSSSAE